MATQIVRIKIGTNDITSVAVEDNGRKLVISNTTNLVEIASQDPANYLNPGNLLTDNKIHDKDGVEVEVNTINKVEFVGLEDDIRTLHTGARLKDELKGRNNGYEDDRLKFIYNHIIINDSGANSNLTNNTLTIDLNRNVDNYNSNKKTFLDISKRPINSNDTGTVTDFIGEMDALYELAGLLKKIETYRGSTNFTHGKDFSFSIPSEHICNPIDLNTKIIGDYATPNNNQTATGLKAYKCDGADSAPARVVNNRDNKKHNIYDTNLFRDNVNSLITHLTEIKAWWEKGFQSKYEVARVIRNGFGVADIQHMYAKKYKGFSALKNTTATPPQTDADPITFAHEDPNWKTKLDVFHTAFGGQTEAKKCRGFQPDNENLDLNSDNNGLEYHSVNIQENIVLLNGVANTDSASKAVNRNEATKKTIDAYMANTSNNNNLDNTIKKYLYENDFQEVDNKSKKELLMLYYIAFQGNTTFDYANNDDNKGKIDDVYNKTNDLLTILDEDYSKNGSKNDTEAQEAKNKLGEYKTKFSGLRSEIDNKIREINERQGSQKLAEEIKAAKQAASEEWKSVYDDTKIASLTILNKVKELIGLVIKVNGNSTDNNTLDSLKGYETKSKESQQSSPEKTAWEIVNKKRDNDDKKENRAQKAFDKISKKDEETKKAINEAIQKSNTEEELKTNLKPIADEMTNENDKKDFNEKRTPCLIAGWKLGKSAGNKTNEDTRLIDLLTKKWTTDYQGQSGFTAINEDIKAMEEYKNANGDDKAKAVEKAGGSEAKSAIETWLTAMKDKQTKLKAEYGDSNENNENAPSDQTFWQKNWGKILIGGFIVTVVLGAIVYFVKKNREEDEE